MAARAATSGSLLTAVKVNDAALSSPATLSPALSGTASRVARRTSALPARFTSLATVQGCSMTPEMFMVPLMTTSDDARYIGVRLSE